MLPRHFLLAPLVPLCAALRGTGDAGDTTIAPKRVAIIGAGAGGSSTAYHLTQYAHNASIPLTIDVFERSSRIGGRTTTVNAWSDSAYPVELGGSIFVAVNHILVDAAREFNLTATAKSVAPGDDDDVPELGIWNGIEFVYVMEGGGGWWDVAKLIWRYGYAPVKTNALMKKTVGKFLRMYTAPIFPWKSLNDVVAEVDLLGPMGVTGAQFLSAEGVSDAFANDIVQASTRVNYALDLPIIHGLETMVCMAANGAMSVAGGNWQIFDRMLHSSSSISTHLNTSITHVSKQPDGTYNLTTSSGAIAQYDEVILASPLQFSNLIIDPAPKHTPDQIPYVKLYTTLFASPLKPSPSAFNLEPNARIPQHILTTLSPYSDTKSPPFNSISIVSHGVNRHSNPPRREYIYKVFSLEPMVDAAFLSSFFDTAVTEHEVQDGRTNGEVVSWMHRKTWFAYPEERPRVTFDEIQLDDGLWYTSAMEPFISTMETSALMGKNVARLVVDRWELSKPIDIFEGVRGEGFTDDEEGFGDAEEEEKEEGWGFESVGGAGEQKPLKANL